MKKYGLVACTHLYMLLDAVNNKCKIPPMSVQQSKNLKGKENSGYWKPEALAADPVLSDAMTRGIEVFLIRWPVRVFLPRVIEILSKADNLQQNNAGAHHEHAVLSEILLAAELKKCNGEEIDFNEIRKVAFESNPPCKPIENEIVGIVQYCSGKNNKPLLEYLACHRDHRPMGRLSAECYGGARRLFPYGQYMAYAYLKYILSSCRDPYTVDVPAASSATQVCRAIINKKPKPDNMKDPADSAKKDRRVQNE